MSDETMRKAVREVMRNDLVTPTISQLIENLPQEQLLEIRRLVDTQIIKRLDWLDDLEGHYFVANNNVSCECVVSWGENGPLNANGETISSDCTRCYGSGYVFTLGGFEESIRSAGGLAIDISSETLQEKGDWSMRTVTEAIDQKPLFVRHLDIDGGQFIKYLVVYPAPKETDA